MSTTGEGVFGTLEEWYDSCGGNLKYIFHYHGYVIQ